MKQSKLGLGEKTIDTPYLFIKGNIMEWDGTMIQLSNASYISSANIASVPFPMWAAALIIAGLLMLKNSWLLGLALAVAGGVWIYNWNTQNEIRKKGAILTIRMNSGHNLFFEFSNKDFLAKVLEVLENTIINGGSSNTQIEINMTNCEMHQSPMFNDLVVK